MCSKYAMVYLCLQKVPKEALKQRMVIEGLDPNVLEWVLYAIIRNIFLFL